MADDGEIPAAEALMTALISKMESMDGDIGLLKKENNYLHKLMSNPNSLMKKLGLVPVSTPFSEDMQLDDFRPTDGDAIFKSPLEIGVPVDNEEFHNTSWKDIHDMANQARAAGHVEEPFKVVARDTE